MARKGENIFKRKDNRWEGRYKKGRKPNGKISYGYIYGKSYNEVKTKLIEFKYKYRASTQEINAYNGTVSDWSVYYMSAIVKSSIKPSSYANYNCMLQNHILPYFGQRKLVSLTTNDMEGFIDHLTQKNLSAVSMRSIFGILNRMLKKAKSQSILLANPCEEAVLPKKEKTKIEVLNSFEQKKLEQTALSDKYGTAVIIALYTGMRIGEIAALRWDDIDFETGIIHVKKTVQRISDHSGENKTRVIFGNPKSESSSRLIPMPEKIKGLLLAQKSNSKSEFVISCKNSFTEPRVIRYRYNKIIKNAGIRYVSFHSLRHTFATRCMELHIDITTLSRLLGHSSVKMTLDIYTDSLLEQRIISMHMLDKLLDIG